MKKGFKGILISGAVALLMGICLIVAGVVAGASWTDVGDTLFSGKYSIGSDWNWGIAKTPNGSELKGETNTLKEVDTKTLEKVTIRMAAGDLNVREGKSEYFQIVNHKNRGDCYIDYEGDELEIVIRGKRNNSRGAKATIWIPRGFLAKDLEIHTEAGRIDTEDLQANNLTMTVGAGQIKTKAIQATQLNIEVDAGEFKNSGKITAEDATLKVAAGNLKVDLLETKHADVNVDVGHMKVKFVGKEADYNIDAECDIGEVNIDGKSYHMGRDYQSHASSTEKTIEIDCNIGQATLDFED